MSNELPWKVWTPDDLAPPMAEFVLADHSETRCQKKQKNQSFPQSNSLNSSSHSCNCRPMSKAITRVWRKVDKKATNKVIRKA